MKKLIIAVILVAAVTWIFTVDASLTTTTSGVEPLVVSAAGGESALATGATTDFNPGVPAPGTVALAPKDLMKRDGETMFNAVSLTCYATATANDTAEMTLYGVSIDSAPIRIGQVTWTFGTARHTSTTVLWADTCVPTSFHATTLQASDIGNNFIANLNFDVTGYRYLYGIVHGTATGAATNITVLMRPY